MSTPTSLTTTSGRTREIARDVLVEAFAASATPFVPVPFVDDWMRARLLRRVAEKVLFRHGALRGLSRVVVDGYVKADARPLATSIVVGATRFVVRKVAMVLDVKKSHDVFGQSIAFALALDIAASEGWLHEASAERVGVALHTVLEKVSSGALESLGRAARNAYTSGGGTNALAEAIGADVEKTREHLLGVLQQELGSAAVRDAGGAV